MCRPDLGSNLRGPIIAYYTQCRFAYMAWQHVSRKQASVKTPEIFRNCSKYYSYKFSSFF